MEQEALGACRTSDGVRFIVTAEGYGIRGVAIRDGQLSEQSIKFSSGSLVVNAELKDGDTLRAFDVYVYYYRAGDHQQPVAYTPAGDTAVLEGG